MTDDEFELPVLGAAGQSDAAGELLTLGAALRTPAEAQSAFGAAEDDGLDGQRVFQHALWLARSVAASGDGAPPSPEYTLIEGALTSAAVVELLANTTLDRGPRYRHEPLGHRWPLAQVLFVLRDGDSAASDALLLASAMRSMPAAPSTGPTSPPTG